METKQDCTEIEQANARLQQRLEDLDDTIRDQQSLLNDLYDSDPQRADLQRELDRLSQQRSELLDEARKGEQALKDCQQGNAAV